MGRVPREKEYIMYSFNRGINSAWIISGQKELYLNRLGRYFKNKTVTYYLDNPV